MEKFGQQLVRKLANSVAIEPPFPEPEWFFATMGPFQLDFSHRWELTEQGTPVLYGDIWASYDYWNCRLDVPQPTTPADQVFLTWGETVVNKIEEDISNLPELGDWVNDIPVDEPFIEGILSACNWDATTDSFAWVLRPDGGIIIEWLMTDAKTGDRIMRSPLGKRMLSFGKKISSKMEAGIVSFYLQEEKRLLQSLLRLVRELEAFLEDE